MAGLNHESWNFNGWIYGLIMGALIAGSHNFLTDRHLFRIEILLLIISGFLLTIVGSSRPWEVGIAIWLGYFVTTEIRELFVFIQPNSSANIPLPLPFIFFIHTVFFALFGAAIFLGVLLAHFIKKQTL